MMDWLKFNHFLQRTDVANLVGPPVVATPIPELAAPGTARPGGGGGRRGGGAGRGAAAAPAAAPATTPATAPAVPAAR